MLVVVNILKEYRRKEKNIVVVGVSTYHYEKIRLNIWRI